MVGSSWSSDHRETEKAVGNFAHLEKVLVHYLLSLSIACGDETFSYIVKYVKALGPDPDRPPQSVLERRRES